MTDVVDEMLEGLDKISEYNKLGKRGHGDLEDMCYICGISPSKLKQVINRLLIEARIEELKYLDTRSFMSTGKDAVMEVWQSDIDARIAALSKQLWDSE